MAAIGLRLATTTTAVAAHLHMTMTDIAQAVTSPVVTAVHGVETETDRAEVAGVSVLDLQTDVGPSRQSLLMMSVIGVPSLSSSSRPVSEPKNSRLSSSK
jgi:hypothetical protein